MRHLPPSRRAQVIALVFVGLLIASLAVPLLSHAQGQNFPLRRDDSGTPPVSFFRQPAGTDSGDLRLNAASVLSSTGFVWVRGTSPLELEMRYICVGSNNLPSQLCLVGDVPATGSTQRRAYAYYTLDGTAPDTSVSCTPENRCVQLLTATLDPPGPAMVFRGSIPATTFANAEDGDFLYVRIRVPLAGQPPQGGNCQGTTSNPCIDPGHTTGQSFYAFRIDKSVPTFTVTDPANAAVFQLTEREWYLYSNTNLTGGGASARQPTITFNVADNATGAPLGSIKGSNTECAATAHFCFWRGGEVHNQPFSVGDGTHSKQITYSYTGGGESFFDNTSTRIDVRFRDTANHQINTLGATNPALWVIMDITPPAVTNGALLPPSGVTVPVGLGDGVRLHVNATDMGADIATPLQFLNVEARLRTVQGDFASDWQAVPYNETLGHFFTDDLRVPTNPAQWASGLARAEVRVTDPVGLQHVRNANGNITVDADTPTITPLAPVAATASTAYTKERDVEFRIRAVDPGNTDAWNGANTPNTDGLGIDFDQVFVHYRVGATGAQTSLRLLPRETESTFSATRTFGEEDAIYYWFSVRDFAGNEATYPRSADPHVTVANVTANGGRLLLVQTDRVGPTITNAKDQTFLGGPNDPEFWFNIVDAGIGTDPNEARLFWRLSSETEYRTVVLQESQVRHPVTNAQLSVFRGTIPRQADGAEVQWYVRAKDRLENEGTLGTPAAPRSSLIDLVPPTVTVNAPARSTESIFNVTWTGTDDRSGIRDYTLQFRIAGGQWVTVPERERTTLTFWEVCAATDRTYEFRVSARDVVGNERGFPESADARTIVQAPASCAEPPRVTLDSPADGTTLSRDVEVTWRAISTTFPDEVQVAIRVVPVGGGETVTLATGLGLSGTYTWRTHAPAASDICFEDGRYNLRVVAQDPLRLEGAAQATVTLANDIDDCSTRRTGPDGAPLGDFDPLYLLVVLAFTGLVAVFVVGMTRRW